MSNFEKDAESLRKIGEHFSYAQAHQDLFVRVMLGFKHSGFYVEIGAAEPKQSNNTYILERDFGWSGISLDIDETLVGEFRQCRRNPCIRADATAVDFRRLLIDGGFPRQVDYLSLDIDPASVTYEALTKLPHDDYRFSVITYEHDFYASGGFYMEQSRKLLGSLNYVRVVSNVKCCGRDFEDWYIDPNVIAQDVYAPYKSNSIECADIFRGLTHG